LPTSETGEDGQLRVPTSLPHRKIPQLTGAWTGYRNDMDALKMKISCP